MSPSRIQGRKDSKDKILTVDLENNNNESIFYVDDNNKKINLKPIHYKPKIN